MDEVCCVESMSKTLRVVAFLTKANVKIQLLQIDAVRASPHPTRDVGTMMRRLKTYCNQIRLVYGL